MDTERLARVAIDEVRASGNEYANLVHREMALEHERAGRKAEAVARIMASGDNPLTHKPHSASSAEAVAETDHAYAAHLAEIREVVLAKNLAFSRLTVAKLEAQLAIALAQEGATL